MLFNAQNGTVKLGSDEMDYVCFGEGPKVLIMLPGLGDALRKIKGTALPFAATYHKHAKGYKVYMFSRRSELPQGYTTRDMARDQAEAMQRLGILKADIMGVSQGGMIAQYLAIDYPELINKLVLVVTTPKSNNTLQNVVQSWIEMVQRDDYRSFMMDTAKKSYSMKFLQKHRFLLSSLGKVGKPKNYTRFLIQANACLNHDAYQELEKITCPTFVIGGDRDQIVGPHSSDILAEKIANCKLHICEGLGHACYEEADDFFKRVLEFLRA